MGLKPYFIDGPLMSLSAGRRLKIELMARVLIENDVVACEQDCIRLLGHSGFAWLDVAILAGEARMVAMQEIVAAEMSKP